VKTENEINQNQVDGCTNSTDVKKFFDQEWDLYKRVINLNYMFHKEVLGVLRKFFCSVPSPTFSVLELGCGDAFLLSNALQETGIETYCGVDISPHALELADENVRLLRGNKRFIEGDLLEEVGKFEAEFDVIVAGYSFHHLTKDEKGQFFKKCRVALKSRGTLIIYDEVCNPGEDRHGFINRFSRICMREWNKLTHEEMLRICDHVESSDYPETFEFYRQLAEECGFRGSQMLFHDKHDLYGVFHFSI
jgi:16S RNA G1207 methylase RsmC